jgi:hypothetical protein
MQQAESGAQQELGQRSGTSAPRSFRVVRVTFLLSFHLTACSSPERALPPGVALQDEPDAVAPELVETALELESLAGAILRLYEQRCESGSEFVAHVHDFADWSVRLKKAECRTATLTRNRAGLVKAIESHLKRIEKRIKLLEQRTNYDVHRGLLDGLRCISRRAGAELAVAQGDVATAVRLLRECERYATDYLQSERMRSDGSRYLFAFVPRAQRLATEAQISLARMRGDKQTELTALQDYEKSMVAIFKRAQALHEGRGMVLLPPIRYLYYRATAKVAEAEGHKAAEQKALDGCARDAEWVVAKVPELPGGPYNMLAPAFLQAFDDWIEATTRLARLTKGREAEREALEKVLAIARRNLDSVSAHPAWHPAGDPLVRNTAKYLVARVQFEILRRGGRIEQESPTSRRGASHPDGEGRANPG